MRLCLRFVSVEKEPLVGKSPLSSRWESLSADEKRDKEVRAKYDDALRRFMIASLMREGRLPAMEEVTQTAFDRFHTIEFLEKVILNSTNVAEDMVGRYAKIIHGRDIVSLELLFNTAVHQLRNELSALEMVAPQGYVYTYDPASIFAGEVGADLLNRIMFAALKYLASENSFQNMRAYGFNDYVDAVGIDLAKAALVSQTHVKVVQQVILVRGT